MLVALTSAETDKKEAAVAETAVEQKQEANTNEGDSVKNKRGLHEALGDYGWSGYGGHDLGHGAAYESHDHFGHAEAHHDFGHHDLGHHDLGHHDFGHHDHGHHDFGGSEHHHEHVKHITIEKKVPVPYTVTKHIPYTVEKKVRCLRMSIARASSLFSHKEFSWFDLFIGTI